MVSLGSNATLDTSVKVYCFALLLDEISIYTSRPVVKRIALPVWVDLI